MSTRQIIPLAFNPADPAGLKRDLQRMTSSLDEHIRGLGSAPPHVPVVDPAINSPNLQFERVFRFAIRTGETITTLLPRPSVKHAGKRIYCVSSTGTGTLSVKVTGGATANGSATGITWSSPRGMMIIMCDGQNFYSVT